MDRPQSGQSEENVAAVRKAFNFNQWKFIWRESSKLNISATSIQRILGLELRLFPFKVQIVQNLKAQDYDSRWEMCKTLLNYSERETLPSWNRCGSMMKLSSTFLVVAIGIVPAYGGLPIPCKSTSMKEHA